MQDEHRSQERSKQYQRGSIVCHHVQAKSELKNLDEIMVSKMGGVNHPRSYHVMFHC